MNNFCVYVHISPSNKKYVGITGKNPERRWREGGKGYRYKNLKLFRAIKKYGWSNFTHKILIRGLTETQAKRWETRLITHWDTCKKGYNCTLGGELNKPDEITAFKISNTLKNKNICQGENNPMWGKKHSEITRKRISKKLKKAFMEGRWKPKSSFKNKSEVEKKQIAQKISKSNKEYATKHSKPIKCIELNTVFYGGSREAAKRMTQLTQIKFSHSGIAEVCRKKRNATKGFHFSYVD